MGVSMEDPLVLHRALAMQSVTLLDIRVLSMALMFASLEVAVLTGAL